MFSFSLFGYDFSISEVITLFCSIFLTCFYAVKTGGLKNLLKECVEMNYKFKTQKDVWQSKGQSFETTKPVYRLNKATGELELTDETVDLQEVINSCLDSALDRVLDRLMPKVQEVEDVAELDTMREDLDFAMQTCDLAEEYREKYNLPETYSVQDIFNEVAKKAEILKAKVDTYQALKKGVNKDEKKETIEESKSENV